MAIAVGTCSANRCAVGTGDGLMHSQAFTGALTLGLPGALALLAFREALRSG